MNMAASMSLEELYDKAASATTLLGSISKRDKKTDGEDDWESYSGWEDDE
jgi:hypothetical protein